MACLRKILVVGMQNTYRSVITAEVIKKSAAGTGLEVECAGVMAFPGIPVEPEAAAQLKTMGIEGEFVSNPLTKPAVAGADMIITVTEKIKGAICAKFPDKAGSVFTLLELAGEPGRDLEAGASTGGTVSAAVAKAMQKISG